MRNPRRGYVLIYRSIVAVLAAVWPLAAAALAEPEPSAGDALTAVPEPATLLLAGAALIGAAVWSRRRRRA